jgi:amino acid transporter
MSAAAEEVVAAPVKATGLERGIDWTGAFWVASGVPPLVLFSIGAVAATVGKLSWIVWAASIALGFIQSFTYAEIAGLFPNKSGGTSVYGAIAWVRYSKVIAPVSVWCNWFAWSPVQATGSALAAGYILAALFAPDSVINTWQITLLDLGAIKTGLTLRINAVFLLGAVILFSVKAIQDGGILRSANTTKILGISAMIPLILIGVVPILTGDLVEANFFPLTPLAHDAAGHIVSGAWDITGITVFAGGMFLAAWSTYGFETAVCYTSELKNPKTDTFKAIFYSGLLCVVVYTLVPFAFQGFLGLGTLLQPAVLDAAGNVTTPAVYGGMLAPDIYSGMGVASVMAKMVHAGRLVGAVVVIMLVLALVLSLITSMAGSSRTLYQASVDGWLPKYLSKVNEHHAPSNAMLTDLCFNLVLLLMSDSVFVIGAANVGYMIFNFLNLNAGWIHRLDRPLQERPWRAPTWVLATGACLSFVNLAFMGFGADVYGVGTLSTGLVFCSLIIPVFIWRHYIRDKGQFPPEMAEDLGHTSDAAPVKRAGIWPFVVLALGITVVAVTHHLARY